MKIREIRLTNFKRFTEVSFHPPEPTTEDGRQKAIYVRSAYRNDPEFQLDCKRVPKIDQIFHGIGVEP